MIKIKNAIISVLDKSDIEIVARELKKFDVNIFATEGTKRILEGQGIQVNSISDISGNQQILDGRVKTLDYRIFAGILANVENKKHLDELKKLNIPKIDLIIVNLYDFVGALSKYNSKEELIEHIDIGGVSLLRAASKNYKSCICIPSIKFYSEFLKHLNANNGCISVEFSKMMAQETFKITCEYDYMIYLGLNDLPDLPGFFPLYQKSTEQLRYGENPHQKAILLTFAYESGDNILKNVIKGVKDISYNNILDSNTAFELVKDFIEPTGTVIKHQNPCAVMSSEDKYKVCSEIFSLDNESSFGGILGVNFTIDLECAKIITQSSPLLHCITAPQITSEATEYIKTHSKWGKNLNIFMYKSDRKLSHLSAYANIDIRSIPGAILCQQKDFYTNEITYEVVSGQVSFQIVEDLLFGFKVAKLVKSNAIVIVKDKKTIAIGSGQTSRIGAVKNAISKIKEIPPLSCLASDGFFPFPDSLEYAKKYGIKNFISPLGSIKDEEVIRYARENNLTLLFTNVRHFRH